MIRTWSLGLVSWLLASCAAAPAVAPEHPRSSSVQQVVDEELARAVAHWQPAAAIVIVLDGGSGQLLAVRGRRQEADAPQLAHEPYVTGSTLKVFTVAAALESGAITADARVDCSPRRYGPAELYDGAPHGELSVGEVLVTSSNVGTSRILDMVGLTALRSTLGRFHFGEAPGHIPPVSDGSGMPAVMLAIGESATATPLQVAAAYAAIWNDGQYFAPSTAADQLPERVLSASTARTLSRMLESAVHGELATGKLARIDGARVAGKTGTAQLADGRLYASFVGTVLDRAARLVVLVGMEAPRDGGTGPSAAAPLFARIASRLSTPTQGGS